MRITLLLRHICAAFALWTPALPAATVQFAGVINDDAGSQISKWRTASTVKALDADGDNLFGTTARTMFGSDSFGAVTVFQQVGVLITTGPFPGYATVDDLSGGNDRQVQTTTNNGVGSIDYVMFSFSAEFDCPPNVRIGVVTDGLDSAQFSPATIGLRQVGGSSAEHVLTAVNNTLDMVFFDVTGVAPGDQFEIFADVGTGGFATIQFATWDALPNAPIVVSNTSDSGPGSLRAALAEAAARPKEDTIIFDPTTMNGATILLTTFTDPGSGNSAFDITDTAGVTIDASALPAGVKLDAASQDFRFFRIGNGVKLALRGLQLLNGGGAAFSKGGAILNEGNLTVSRCTFAGNHVGSVGGTGGAIYTENTGSVELNQSTLSGNSAQESGGAIATNGGFTIMHCTLSGNSAGRGGAIINLAGFLFLTHCTISGNTAPPGFGSGVASVGGTLQSTALRNSILSGNTNSDADVINLGDSTNSFFSLGGNLIGNGNATGAFSTSVGDIFSNAPLIAPLARYGGPTATMPPLPGSPALDAVSQIAGLAADQRGAARGSKILIYGSFAQPLSTEPLTFRGSARTGLSLTTNLSDQQGSIILPDIGDISGFSTSFIYRFRDPENDPGNGLSFCFGPDPGGTINGSGTGMAHAVCFDITNSGSGQFGVISYRKNGVVQASNATTLDRVADNRSARPVNITLTNTGLLTVKYKGVTVLDAIPTGYTYAAGDRIIFGASTGSTSSAEQQIAEVGVLGKPTSVPDIGAVEALAGPVDAVVTSNADAGAGTLRDLLSVVPAGSTITFDPKIFNGGAANTIALTTSSGDNAFSIDKSVTIDATAIPKGVRLNGGSQNFRFFRVTAGTSLALHGLTLSQGGGATFSGGGAILNEGTLSLARCTLSDNTAFGSGGAISNNGALSMWQCTLSGNRTTDNFGGALINFGGTAMLTHCTISANIAPPGRGSGVASYGIFTTETLVQNCIISGNTDSNVDFIGGPANTFTSLGGNLIGAGNATSDFNAPGDILSDNPRLSGLGDNGGPTPTMSLLIDSPARGAASILAPPISADQRGFPIAGLPDIGAYEFPNTPPSTINTAAVATTGDQTTVTVSASDVDGIAPVVASTSAGSGLTVNATNGLKITFTPAPDFAGDVSLGYTVSDGNGGFASGTVLVSVTDNDPPGIAAPIGGFSPLMVYSGTMPDFRSQAVLRDNVGTPIVTQSPPQGSATIAGVVPVTLTATDGGGNTATITFDVIVRPAAPVHTTRVAVDGINTPLAPGAGTNGLPSDAKLVSFSLPAISSTGDIAFVGKWKSAAAKGTALFLNDKCLAVVGGDASTVAAGATWTSFTDPVAEDGRLACIATISTGAKAIVSNFTGAALESIARTGETAADAGDAKFKKFHSIALHGGAIGFHATLGGGTGTNKITASNDSGVWSRDTRGTLHILYRDSITLDKIVGSFVSFTPGNGSPGQGRGWVSYNQGPLALTLSTYTDKTKAIIVGWESGATVLARTGEAGTNFAPALTGASYASLGLPAMNDTFDTAFHARMKTGAGGVTKANADGIFVASGDFTGSFAPHELVARVGEAAGATGTKFLSFKDPVISADGGMAFPAALKSIPTVKGSATQTLWWRPAGQPLSLLAQGGMRPGPDLPLGAQWKTFDSLAISNRGPIFAATLAAGKGGVTSRTATGVWACDFTGTPRVLFRTGDTINGKKLTKFALLKATVGNAGVTRSFNDSAQIVWSATFSDKSTAIVVTEIP